MPSRGTGKLVDTRTGWEGGDPSSLPAGKIASWSVQQGKVAVKLHLNSKPTGEITMVSMLQGAPFAEGEQSQKIIFKFTMKF